MAKQSINIGSSANDGTGDPLRTAFDKINDNFTELYGSTAEANDLIEDSTPQLGGDLDVNGRRITSARSNEDIILLPNGTGGVVASALRFAGTTISSDDSSSVNINEGLIVDGTASVSGNATVAGTLGVTGVATFTATPVFSSDITVTDDINLISDSAVITFGADNDTSLTHTDGTGLTLNSTNKLCFNDASQFIQGSSATVLSIGATDEIDLTATDIDVNGTMSVSGTLTTASIATTGTHTVTGTAALDGVTIKDNTIASNASNADLEISANGTGKVEIEGVSFFGTTLTAADSSTININEGLVVDGTINVSGASTLTGAVTASSTLGVSGVTTLTTTNIDNLTIQDANITSSSNSNINITPGGTGSVIAAGLTLKGTSISAADSSTVNINEGLTVDGTLTSRGNIFGVQTLTGSGSTEVVNLTDTVTLLVTTGGSQAFSLADGVEGQIKIISMKTDGGSGIVTPANFVNGTTITFDDVEDTVTLLYQSTGWVALARQNATFG